MNTVAAFLTQQIRKFGPLSFAEFMQHSLYFPELGYYEKEDTIGRVGDFYTSVSVGSAFGQLLAFKFARWVEAEAPAVGEPLEIIEAGAHNGRLACDVLTALQQFHPEIYSRVRYWIVEPSKKRTASQRETLRKFDSVTRWVADLSQLGTPGRLVKGRFRIIFSNELLDSMPVHVIRWKTALKQWVEMGVDLQDNQFVWKELAGVERPAGCRTRQKKLAQAIRDTLCPLETSALIKIIPDGFSLEIPVAAIQWWHDAGKLVGRGKLISFDYGFGGEVLRPGSPNGSLRGFHRHHLVENVLDRPSEIDITSHVNFSVLVRTGEKAGLHTELLSSQELFLCRVAAERLAAEVPDWNAKEKRQFLTLVHPEHLGAAFKVLIQSKHSS